MKNRIGAFPVFNALVLVLFGLAVLFPFYHVLMVSLVTQSEYAHSSIIWFPKQLTFDSYKFLFSNESLINAFKTSLFIVLVGVAYNMILTLMTAYALSRPHFPGRILAINLIVFTMFFNGGLIPFYLTIQKLHLIDSIWSLIIPTGISTFYLLIVKTYLQTLPEALIESAQLDGAGEFIILFRIVLPLSMPILATISLFYAVDRWNDWYSGLLFINSPEKLPLQNFLRMLLANVDSLNQSMAKSLANQDNMNQDGVKMAAVIVSAIPVMAIYPFVQRYFVKGIMLGAVKA